MYSWYSCTCGTHELVVLVVFMVLLYMWFSCTRGTCGSHVLVLPKEFGGAGSFHNVYPKDLKKCDTRCPKILGEMLGGHSHHDLKKGLGSNLGINAHFPDSPDSHL